MRCNSRESCVTSSEYDFVRSTPRFTEECVIVALWTILPPDPSTLPWASASSNNLEGWMTAYGTVTAVIICLPKPRPKVSDYLLTDTPNGRSNISPRLERMQRGTGIIVVVGLWGQSSAVPLLSPP
ncbi:hypothetical protein XPA_004312 [Xanthoria parietina]